MVCAGRNHWRDGSDAMVLHYSMKSGSHLLVNFEVIAVEGSAEDSKLGSSQILHLLDQFSQDLHLQITLGFMREPGATVAIKRQEAIHLREIGFDGGVGFLLQVTRADMVEEL